ncbi:hypothetical protein CXG81DRAFT_11101 [Caulochytrium protostelioides]|uniref:P-loop containing nucleoside triphosphate hydrolase protein n=1 Tax=Caulochytrium protostelioides TaxID=1555241 RepID=A0A4P9XAN1_9FUNG|nr:hypothetical protein CXG81DRAFT_11101 [Caulochytrium protostelioides]|eukprot:RKP02151.1 hypothetical protein CXG81DRAFT_11101 [Caulochytrium protostelioides]
MGILEKIEAIKAEMARTQRNKATERSFGVLKARLAKLVAELTDPAGGGSKGGGTGFDVRMAGDARVAQIGMPSVGKSSLLNKLTGTQAEAAAYEFTTLTCVPGRIQHNGATIQFLDLPGIIEGAAQGKGRGRQVIATAKTADLILMMLDATKDSKERRMLEAELEHVGLRLNTQPPDLTIKIKKGGGISFTTTVPLTHLDQQLVVSILHDARVFNADVLIRADCTVDEFIDVLIGNRRYVRCLYCYNKIDSISIEAVDALAREPNTVVISVESELNLDYLVERIWKELDLIRVYTKRKGELPDFSDGLILPRGTTVQQACMRIHKGLLDEFKYALVWGRSAKHTPQIVGLGHVLDDEDVIFIV